MIQLGVTFHTTNSTPSPSPPKTLHRHIVDHHITSHTPPLPIWTNPIPVWVLQHSTTYMQKHPYPIFSTSQVNRLHSTHVYLFSIPQYGHAWSKYHLFTFLLPYVCFILPCDHVIIPHAIPNYSTCLLPFTTYYVSILSIYKHQVLVLYFPSFKYQLSSPLLSHFASEVYSLHLKSRACR